MDAARLLLALPLSAALSATPHYARHHPQHARRHSAAAMQMLQDRPPSPPPASSALPSGLSAQMRDVRAQLEADEQASAMMQALRGSNLNDDDNAASGTTMKVVEMRRGEGDDVLPLVYDPEALAAYFAKRPLAVATRVAQVASASAGWLASVLFDAARGELTAGSEAEVEAVGRLRGVLVSLGPFFIKLGQALSIRPDILSPQAMVQLQQLCDKVPPFDSNLAMATIREDLNCEQVCTVHTHTHREEGCSLHAWHTLRPSTNPNPTPPHMQVSNVFSEITPEPVAAASLGQVYKATLRDSGDEVAVKVQRPFVLETVSLDLHLARMLGLLLRQTPISQRIDVVGLLDEFAANFYQVCIEQHSQQQATASSTTPLVSHTAVSSSPPPPHPSPLFYRSSITSSSARTASVSPRICKRSLAYASRRGSHTHNARTAECVGTLSTLQCPSLTPLLCHRVCAAAANRYLSQRITQSIPHDVFIPLSGSSERSYLNRQQMMWASSSISV